MKARILCTLLLVFSQSSLVYATELFNGKTLAMGGVGIAGSDYKNGALLNPALAAQYENNDNFSVNSNLGLILSDEDDLLDNADDLSDLLNILENTLPTNTDLDQAINLLGNIDGAFARISAGTNLLLSIANDIIAATLFIRGDLFVGAQTNIADADIAYLNGLRTQPAVVDINLLSSEVFAVGATRIEYGVSLAKTFNFSGIDITFGVSPKIQDIETLIYQESVADFDEDDFDSDQFTADESNFNADLGVLIKLRESWRFGVTYANAIEQDYKTILPTVDLTIEPLLAAGAAYKNHWLLTEVNIELNATEDFITGEDSRFIRIGTEFDVADWVQLRIGYRNDLEGTLADIYSAGLGFSPFGLVNLDVAVTGGDNESIGGALQLGFNF